MAWKIMHCGELPDAKTFKEACKTMFQKIEGAEIKPSPKTPYPLYLLGVFLKHTGGDFPVAAHPSLNFYTAREIARELGWVDKNDNWIG